MLSAVAIFGFKGEILALRSYRDDVAVRDAMTFALKIIELRCTNQVN